MTNIQQAVHLWQIYGKQYIMTNIQKAVHLWQIYSKQYIMTNIQQAVHLWQIYSTQFTFLISTAVTLLDVYTFKGSKNWAYWELGSGDFSIMSDIYNRSDSIGMIQLFI